MDHHQTHTAKVPNKEGIGEPVQDEVTHKQNLTEIKQEGDCDNFCVCVCMNHNKAY